MADDLVTCRKFISERCTEPLALPLYGDEPSPGICRRCQYYEGPSRGLGDIVHTIAQVTGAARLAKAYERRTGRSCGCQARREALNDALPKLSTRDNLK